MRRRASEVLPRGLVIWGLIPGLVASVRGAEPEDPRPTVVIVVGAPGTDEYGAEFERWADRWESVAHSSEARTIRIGPGAGTSAEGSPCDRDRLQEALVAEVTGAFSGPLWVVLLGHGTFDGRVAKFNLQGPDVSAEELAEWLKPSKRLLAVINCSSASGPFINHLSGPDRVIVTATKSGYEYHYARFGQYLSEAIGETTHDLDKDDQVSLLEAFLVASSQTAEFYEVEARLATEHALIDDNGDGLGTPAEWFRGVRVQRRPSDDQAPDGRRANQLVLSKSAVERTMTEEIRQRRDALELALETLRETKDDLEPNVYYERLERIALELARLYEGLEPEPPR